MQTCEIGDVVAWDKVPNGALVFANLEQRYAGHALKVNDRGEWVHDSVEWYAFDKRIAWPWDPAPITIDGTVTIVALGLTGEETVEQFQALAGHVPVRVAGDGPHHGYVNTDAAHMPGGVDERLQWDARLRQRGDRDES